MRVRRAALTLLLIAGASAACSAILDLQPPPTPPEPAPSDASSPEPDAGSSNDAASPVVCSPLDAAGPPSSAPATYYPLEPGAVDDAGTLNWELFDPGAPRAGYAGGAFDGRYVYFAPSSSGDILRFDTLGALSDLGSWSTFAAATKLGAAAFSGAVFDGRYVYFVPHGTGAKSLVARLDSRTAFADLSSWATFDTAVLSADGGTPTLGFSGATFDGRYIYFIPTNNGSGPDGRVIRYDTTGAADAGVGRETSAVQSDIAQSNVSANGPDPESDADAGAADSGDAGAKPSADAGSEAADAGPSDAARANADAASPDGSDAGPADAQASPPGPFQDPAWWSTFDTSALAVEGGAPPVGFAGAAFDGTQLYFAPHLNGGPVNGGQSAIAARLRTDASFSAASAWSTVDLTTQNGDAFDFWGAAYDGRYVYLVPNAEGVIMRFDTTAPSLSAAAGWSAYDLARVARFDAGRIIYAGAAFDGRFIYVVPATAGFGVVSRYDTLSTFTADCAWSTVDLAVISGADAASPTTSYFGAVFDGQYVYFVPKGVGPIARFLAKSPASMPKLPAFFGSFY